MTDFQALRGNSIFATTSTRLNVPNTNFRSLEPHRTKVIGDLPHP